MLNKDELKDYQKKMDKLAVFKQEYNIKLVSFQEENEKLINDIKQVSDELFVDKENIKVVAIEDFKKNGVKQLLGGLSIRVGTELEYDEFVALVWAKEHSMCLKLDSKAFENIAKVEDIDFVSKLEKVTVCFPKEIVGCD